jgi:predicted ArsR family transcriptional regulator
MTETVPMQRTRRAIMDHLKRHPGAALAELAAAAGVAPITVRAHVGSLVEAGLARYEEVRRGRGRPFRRYYLTDQAEPFFPKQYDRLAADLLAGVAELEGSDAVGALVRHVAGGMAAPYLSRVTGKSLPERVVAIAEIIEEQGGAAQWQATDAGYVVHEHNCPYPSVSRCSDHVCEIDRQVVARLADAPVEVTQRLRDGADSCAFVIAPAEHDSRAAHAD